MGAHKRETSSILAHKRETSSFLAQKRETSSFLAHWYLQWLLTRSCITRSLTKVRCFLQWLHTRPQTLGSHQSPLPNSKARSSIRRTPTEVRRVIHKTGTKTLSKNVGLPVWPPPVRRE